MEDDITWIVSRGTYPTGPLVIIMQAETELQMNHEFNMPATQASEAIVQVVVHYMIQHENLAMIDAPMYSDEKIKLHSIFT